MADARRFELDELVIRPGTYFNPETEVLVIVDDSPALDQEIFSVEDHEGADWVLVSDEVPVDEHRRDEVIDAFQVRYHPGAAGSIVGDDPEEIEPELEPDEDLE